MSNSLFANKYILKKQILTTTHKTLSPLIKPLKMRDWYIKSHTNNFRITQISCHFLMCYVLFHQIAFVLFLLPGTSSFSSLGISPTPELQFNRCAMFFHTSKSLCIPFSLPRMPFLYFSGWQVFTVLSRTNIYATSSWRTFYVFPSNIFTLYSL